MKKLLYGYLILSFVLLSCVAAYAASGPDYWLGDTSVNFADFPDNWTNLSTNNPPVSGDSIVFDTAGLSPTTLNNNLTSFSTSGITFNADSAAYTINGNSISLTGNIADNSSNNETLGMAIASGTVTNSGSGSGSVIISGDIGSGVTTVTQASSSSSLILNGSNSYSGATTVSSGILNVQSDGALAGNGVTVDSGATLQLEGGIMTAAIPLTLNGTGVSSNGALENFSGDNTYAGSITLGSAAQINADSGTALTLSGGISGNGLTTGGAGTIILSTTNTYTGATTVNSGILNIQSNGALAGSGVTVENGATLQIDGGITTAAIPLTIKGTGVSGNGALENVSGSNTYAGLITLGSAAQINADTNSSLILSNSGNIIGGGNTLTIAGAGNTTINSVIDNSVSSLTKEGTGILTLSADNTITGGINFNAGIINATALTNLGSGALSFNGGTLQFGGVFDPSSLTMTFNSGGATFDTNGQAPITFNNAVGNSGTGGLTKTGLGTLILIGANTYTGSTTITEGTLQIGNGSSTTNSLTGTGNVRDNANLIFNLNSGASIANAISGTGTVTQNGSGTVTLSGDNNYSGATTVNSGTLEAGVIAQAFGIGSAVSVGTGATLDIGGYNETIASLTGNGTVTNSGGSAAILTVGDSTPSSTFSGNILDGTSPIGINKQGTGTLVLSGTNTYSGGTTLSNGTLNLDSATPVGSGTITFAGGTLQYSANNNTDYSGQFSTTAANQAFNIDTNGQVVVYVDPLISNGGGMLIKMGLGMLTLNGASSYSGATMIEGGTLQIGNAASIPSASDVNIDNGAFLDLAGFSQTIGSLAGAGTVTNSGGSASLLTVGDSTPTSTFSGNIQDDTSAIGINKQGTGTLVLSGTNTYSGGTTINAGTLAVGNPSALGSGFVTNNATLALGTTSLSIGENSAYAQIVNSNLNLTIASSTSYGNITNNIVSAVAASVAAASSVNVYVGYDIPTNTTFTIINTQGAGLTGNTLPQTINSSSQIISFSGSMIDNNFIITADNIGFAPFANNANAKAVANVLDNITNPTTDMSNVLATLVNLSEAKITSALNTMGPIVDGGVIQDTNASLNNFIGTSLDRIQDVLNRENIINASLDQAEKGLTGDSAGTGISSGDGSLSNGIWAKPFGGYLNQGTLQGIQGYDAWNSGTVVGYDHMITDNFTMGISGAYAYGQVDSDANNANTDINSAQGTIYAGYQDPDLKYFIDAAGSFAWNWYDGNRDISIGPINRTAVSDYDGQQYSTYIGGGYKLDLGKNFEFTPLASLQWTHTTIDSYTETNAGALDLNVNSQNYDILESGLGASISHPEQYDWGIFTPEFHVKWLYDFINDDMSVTSTFAGGGGSFTTHGATPAKEGADIGGKLSFGLNNDLSLIAKLDTTLKDQFFGIYGSGTVSYKF